MRVRHFYAGFTMIELIVVVAITIIVAGMIVATFGSFNRNEKLSTDTSKLLGDLMVTQQFATTQRNQYKYYGLRLYSGLGEKGDRVGDKIVRYDPPAGVEPRKMDAAQAGHLSLSRFSVIKSCDSADSPEFLDDTFFSSKVSIDASSEFQVKDATPPKLDSIVFIPVGSATYDGVNLLNTTNDQIVLLSDSGEKSTIKIIPLTGHVSVQ